MALKLRSLGRRAIDLRAGPRSALRMMWAVRRWVTLAAVPRPPRTDLLLALGLAAVSPLQVTVVYPIASTAVGVLVALAITLPVAWRRVHPVAATIATSLA